MKRISVLTVSLLAALCTMPGVFAQDIAIPSDDGMFPFVISYAKGSPAVDYSFLLDGPAGKDGFLRIENGHFANDKGRVRLNATNLTAAANFPTHEQAERMASRLARLGINCVRLHYMDWSYGPGGFNLEIEPGIFAEDGSERNFDRERLDRLEYLISQFKQRGIYVDVNLYVARYKYKYKGVNAVTPEIQAKEREYARDLLTHVNPYTGLSLAEDPCMALVELNNEDALFSYYFWNSVHQDGWPTPAQLRQEYSDEQKRAFFHTLESYERSHWDNMYSFIKEELGVKVPVTSTQVDWTMPSCVGGMDYYDHHAYWQHPQTGAQWRTNNIAMVNDPAGGEISHLITRRFDGKPFTVSEYNHPYPSFYGAEGQPMLHAYAAFQGWDGVFAYSYNNRMDEEPEGMEYFFSFAARTDALAHFIACAAMYLRGDVTESARCLTPVVTLKSLEDQWVDKPTAAGDLLSLIKSSTDGHLTEETMLQHKVSIALDGDTEVNKTFPEQNNTPVHTSDTRQIEWNNEDPEKGLFFVRTPNVKLFSGFTEGKTLDLGDGVSLSVGPTKLGWTTISLTSREANGFRKHSKALLAATGYTHNKGARFSIEKDNDGNPTKFISAHGDDWGTGPMVTEGIPASITLPSRARRTKCWALDESGERKAEVPVRKGRRGKAVLEIGPQYKTVWYEIVVR